MTSEDIKLTAKPGREQFIAFNEIREACHKLKRCRDEQKLSKAANDRAYDLWEQVKGCLTVARMLRYGGKEWARQALAEGLSTSFTETEIDDLCNVAKEVWG